MNIRKFKEDVKKISKKEPIFKDLILAFLGGGMMGIIAQGLIDLYTKVLNFTLKEGMALTSITVVITTSLLTLLGWYRYLGNLFGAGLFIPTTGFANSVTSSAMEGRHEGIIVGIGSQMFSLAGSVITIGVSASVIFIIIKNFLQIWGL